MMFSHRVPHCSTVECYNYVKEDIVRDQIIDRWQRAAERAQDEKVRVLAVDGEYRATSSSRPLGSYKLTRTQEGWSCECPANREYGAPCKHLWALADALDLDPFTDIHVTWTPGGATSTAA